MKKVVTRCDLLELVNDKMGLSNNQRMFCNRFILTPTFKLIDACHAVNGRVSNAACVTWHAVNGLAWNAACLTMIGLIFLIGRISRIFE